MAANKQLSDSFSVGPKSYMDLGPTSSSITEVKKSERFEQYLNVLKAPTHKAYNAVDVVQLLNTTIMLGERAYWGDNFPHQDRMYPLTLLGTKHLKGHPSISVLVSAKQAVLIAPNGAYQIWRRDDQYNLDFLKLTEKLVDVAGSNGRSFNQLLEQDSIDSKSWLDKAKQFCSNFLKPSSLSTQTVKT